VENIVQVDLMVDTIIFNDVLLRQMDDSAGDTEPRVQGIAARI
jgi:hypothetical protein